MAIEFRDELLHSYTDEELLQYNRSLPWLCDRSSVRALSAKYVSKAYYADEFEDVSRSMQLASELGVRVPRIRRVLRWKEGAICIMDRIPGDTLERTWDKLSFYRTIRLTLQLRRFIRQLRTVTSRTAGSLVTGKSRSFWLEDKYEVPDNSSPADIKRFLQFWANFTNMRKAIQIASQGGSVDPNIPVPPVEEEFVFTHHDLAPRNLMIDSSGDLWLIDWDRAGFYPTCFEHAASTNFHVPNSWNWFARWRWNMFTGLAMGFYKQSTKLLRIIQSRFTLQRAGRRMELLKNGGPAGRPVS